MGGTIAQSPAGLATPSGPPRTPVPPTIPLMPRNEAQTRFELIDPALEDRGWNRRTELRDNGLGDFQAAFGNDAAEIDTRNPQKNAKVIIATYQTLDHKKRPSAGYKATVEDDPADPQAIDPSFFLKHYPPGYFDVIVIDECHAPPGGQPAELLRKTKETLFAA